MSPRPILKRSTPETAIHHQSSAQRPHGVHFPPSPSLTRTFHVDSKHVYDRSPIVVTPNSCALPARGCPGHTYFDEPTSPSSSTRRPSRKPRDYHPRALAFASDAVPQLIPDLSSESDESDGPISLSSSSSTSSTSSTSSSSGVMFGPHGLPANLASIKTTTMGLSMNRDMHTHGYAPVDADEDTHAQHALAFLPYSPSSPYPYEDSETLGAKGMEKHRRRRPSRERRHESMSSSTTTTNGSSRERERDSYRIPSGEVQTQECGFALAFSNLAISATTAYPSSPSTYSPSAYSPSTYSPSTPTYYPSAPSYMSSSPSTPTPSPKKRTSSRSSSRRSNPLPTSFGSGGFSSMSDDGCLGGF
ncbi:hypothetical protein CPB83DRAFT_853865 [Crepidotus variabilis]|uniref:Uncharacterized protein n=1 Tax=Crepidotus variabilis TaxID=179855 RepID=A0A9P6EGV4_9AGAR|nr:hypothetical protein CPB83DRAFT_853865 [Crepidotus variabilis]